MSYIWFWVHWLAEHAPISATCQFTKLTGLTVGNAGEGAKNYYLTIIIILLYKTENGRKWLIFDSVCTGSQSIPQNLVNIDLPNLVGWLKETLSKEQKSLASYSTTSFIKNPKSTIQHWKWAEMTYICFWMHWLAEHAPKSGKYRFTKFRPLTKRDPKEGTKIILKLLFLTWRPVLTKKTKNTKKRRKRAKMSYICFWVHWLAGDSRKSAKYRLTKFGRLNAKYPMKEVQII